MTNNSVEETYMVAAEVHSLYGRVGMPVSLICHTLVVIGNVTNKERA